MKFHSSIIKVWFRFTVISIFSFKFSLFAQRRIKIYLEIPNKKDKRTGLLSSREKEVKTV